MAKSPTTKKSPKEVVKVKPAAAATSPSNTSSANEAGGGSNAAAPAAAPPIDFQAELTARLNAQLDALAVERGVPREELVAFAKTMLSGTPTAPEPHHGIGEDDGKVKVTVTGPKGGRYRTSRYFGAEASAVAVTLDERAELMADPHLHVVDGWPAT